MLKAEPCAAVGGCLCCAVDACLLSSSLCLSSPDSFSSEPNLDFRSGLALVSQHDIDQVRFCPRTPSSVKGKPSLLIKIESKSFFLFPKDTLFFFFLRILYVCMKVSGYMYVYHVHTWYPSRPEGGFRSPGTGVRGGDLMWVLETEQVLLAAYPSLAWPCSTT